MKRNQRVVWQKGMFLTPQHFQAQDNFLESLVHFRSAASSNWDWGITELRLNPEALVNNVVQVERCIGVMPDGLTFHVGDTEDPPPSRTIGDHFKPEADSLDVFLAVPNLRPKGPNTTRKESSNGNVRFQAVPQPVVDDLDGVEEKTVEFARTTLRIVFGDEAIDGYMTVRIGQIIRDSSGNYIYDPKFVAPCLNYAHSVYLLGLVRRQIEILASRSTALTPFRRDKSKSISAFNTSDVTNFWMLHTVHSALPVLKHFWKAGAGHPEALYRTMLQLAGGLSTLSKDYDPNQFQEYDHHELGPRFTELDEIIRAILRDAVETGYISIAFVKTQKKYIRAAKIEESQLSEGVEYFLAVSAKMAEEDLIKGATQLIKIASTEDIGRLVDNALPGLPLRYVQNPPSQIHYKFENKYFRVEHQHSLWSNIRRSHTMSAYVPAEIVEPALELLIVRET